MTEETATVLRKLGYSCDCRGFIDVKGKGELKTFFVCTDTSKQQSMGLSWGSKNWLLCGKDCNCGASLYHIDVVGPYCFNTNNIFVYIQSPPVDAVFVFGVCGQCACILHSWQIQLALRPLVVYQNYGFWLGPDSTSILGSGWEGIHTAVTV